MVNKWLKKLQPVLFPSTCRLCRAAGLPGLELCSACLAELPWITHSCSRCGLPLPREADITLCFDCIKNQPSVDRCTALFAYRPPVDRWIQDLKFAQDLAKGINVVINNTELQESMANKGRKRVEETFDWSAIAKQIETLYKSLKH